MLCGHRADAGARSRGRRWHRLAWQKHDVIEPRIRDLVLSRGNFDDAGVCAGHGEKNYCGRVQRVASMPARPARLLRRTKWMRDAAFPI